MHEKSRKGGMIRRVGFSKILTGVGEGGGLVIEQVDRRMVESHAAIGIASAGSVELFERSADA